ncbi:MAG TPA: phage holin family protein [Sphingomicrobium sp.]|jgi:hypothetical protein
MRDDIVRDGPMTEAPMRAPDDNRPAAAGESSAFKFENRHDPIDRQHIRGEEESLPDLLRNLVHQGSHLAEKQTKLVESEVRAATTDLKESIGAMAGAGVVGIGGLGVLLMGISFALGTMMPLWLATMIVAAATLAGAYAMFAAGKRKLQSKSLTMDRTRHTLERAPAAMSGQEKGMHNGR